MYVSMSCLFYDNLFECMTKRTVFLLYIYESRTNASHILIYYKHIASTVNKYQMDKYVLFVASIVHRTKISVYQYHSIDY
jgi:hypothetical protein